MKAKRHNAWFQRLLEAGSRTTYHGKIRGRAKRATVRKGRQSTYKGVRIIPVGDGSFETSLDSSQFDSLGDAKRFVTAWKKRGNPSPFRKTRTPRWVKEALGRDASQAKVRKATEQLKAAYLRDVEVKGRPNPPGSKGKFERCVKAVSERGGARDPRAVCGAMEKRLQSNPTIRVRPSGRFKGRWEVGVPGYPVETKKSKRGAMSLARAIQKEQGGEIIELDEPAESRPLPKLLQNPEDVPNKRAFVGARRKDGKYPVQLVYPLSGARSSKLMTQEQVDRLRSEGFDVFASSRRNPASAAVDAYRDFHGRDPDESITISRKVHHHRHLASAGELRRLEGRTVAGGKFKLKWKGEKPLLAFNEDRNQLFIEGGNQAIDLKAFGITRPHELETLGSVTHLDYFTRKDHLGSEGGTAIYRHKFRTVNQGGRPVTVKILRYPDLIYRVRDEHLEFSGGSYTIEPEGIDQ